MTTQAPSAIEELRNRIREIENGDNKAANLEAGVQSVASRGARKATQARRAARPKKPASYTGEDVAEATEQMTEEKAFRKIERLACVREQASKALQARLEREGYEPHVANAAIERARSCGLISDERYADVLVRSRLSQGKGLQGIAAELEALDIDPRQVDGFLEATEQTSGPDELARALALLDAKPPRGKRPRESAYRKLMQKGYGATVSASAARIWTEEHCASDAEPAL